MKVKQMTLVVHTSILTKEFLSPKKAFFLLICLHNHLIDHISRHTSMGKFFFTVSFTSLKVFFFLIFHFKYVLREVRRKVAMGPVFSMDRSIKAKLCLWAPPLLINLTESLCTNSGMAQTRITPSITGKVELTITPMEWLLATHTEIQEEKHLTLSHYLNQFWGIRAILKALQGLASKPFNPGLQLPRQPSYTKCLVALLPDVISDAQNRHWKKKRNLDSNPRYDPDEGNWHLRAYSKWYYARPGMVSFEQMLKLLMNLLIFLMVKTFS